MLPHGTGRVTCSSSEYLHSWTLTTMPFVGYWPKMQLGSPMVRCDTKLMYFVSIAFSRLYHAASCLKLAVSRCLSTTNLDTCITISPVIERRTNGNNSSGDL